MSRLAWQRGLFASAPGKDRRRIGERVVGVQAEAIEGPRQEAQLGLRDELQTANRRVLTVERLRHSERLVVDDLGRGEDVDVVMQLLVKHTG